jgi:hypothetical protein
MKNCFQVKLIISSARYVDPIKTDILFDCTYSEPNCSSIDEFLKRLYEVNKLVPSPSDFNPLQAQLVLLGAVAAVESYFRSVFRKCIISDAYTSNCVVNKEISFGAALHVPKHMLPEAIMERFTFVSKKTVNDALRDIIGFKGNFPPDFEYALDQYVKVCHLRHCSVHRFGKLGTNNAIALGLGDHHKNIEKPLRLNYESIQRSIAVIINFAITVNNLIFNLLIYRLPPESWSGVYKNDKKLFKKYFDIFEDTVTSSVVAKDMRSWYLEFLETR